MNTPSSTSSALSPADRRAYVDNIVARKQLSAIVDAIINETDRLVAEEKAPPELIGEVHATAQGLLDERDEELALARASAMLRYLLEDGSYVADLAPLRYLERDGHLQKGMPLLDLGTGSGAVIHDWARRDNPAMGIDLSPSFVMEHRNNREGEIHFGVIDGDVHLLRRRLAELCLGAEQNHVVLSSLTLDRVGKPQQLINNMSELAGDDGTLAVFTLLPVQPEDDENVASKIVYTPEQHRITTGATLEQDLRELEEFIGDTHRALVDVIEGQYNVQTSTGPKTYENYYGFVAKRG